MTIKENVFVLLAILLIFSQCCLADNQIKKYPVFEIIPGKSLAGIAFGDSKKIVQQKLDKLSKEYNLKDLEFHEFNSYYPIIGPLKFTFSSDDNIKQDKMIRIRWYASTPYNLKYKNIELIGRKTTLSTIQKLFPMGKVVDYSSIDETILIYDISHLGLEFYFEPLKNLFFYDHDIEKINQEKKHKYCFKESYAYKYYNCYALTHLIMYDPKDK